MKENLPFPASCVTISAMKRIVFFVIFLTGCLTGSFLTAAEAPTALETNFKQAWLVRYPRWNSADVRVKIFNPPALTDASYSQWDFSLQERGLGRLVIPLQKIENEKVVSAIPVVVQVDVYVPVARAAKKIPRGSAVTSENVRFVTGNISRLPETIYLDWTELADHETAYSIPRGGLITRSAIKMIPLIREGDKIKIQYHIADMLTVEADGIARRSGGKGDKLRVQHRQTQKYLEGIVIDRYTVKVE